MLARFFPWLLLFVLAVPWAAPQDSTEKPNPQDFFKQGHSAHGEAFDVGPREKPWVIEGIGKTHFPITTAHPEVQKWFDQGHTLLHSFWYYEAERAFRWCLKLDPDCAMAYWGLARVAREEKRSAAFIREAARRKHKVGERERLYIEAWEARWHDEPKDPSDTQDLSKRRNEKFKYLLEKICLKYPDDLEAQSLLALENLRAHRYGSELMLRQVLARDPNHPGAHHYRIHLWDGREGAVALDSCAAYGRLAPDIGHAQHMPGHIYSEVGMWHEAAISMDAATRVEAGYMRQRMIFPFNDWNYGHNRNYLSYIQEQLGMADAAIRGAQELLAGPLDPQYHSSHQDAITALLRALIKFERWDTLLNPKTFPWRDQFWDKMHKAYGETLAHVGTGNLEKAAESFGVHAGLYKDLQKSENKWLDQTYAIQSLEMRARLALAKGDALNGLSLLGDAARREGEMRERSNDPPAYPTCLYNILGRAYLAEKSPALAAAAFEKALDLVRSDGFALSGLVEAYAALDKPEAARSALARLLFVWSDADPGLKWLARAQAVGLEATPEDTAPAPQRNYKRLRLDHFGPIAWEPYGAPALDALDSKGKRVSLEEYRGKNVLLIFYLGEECPHCMEQLVEVAKKKDDFRRLDTEVLAISRNTPQSNAASLKVGELPFRLLSDVGFENARRFKSYDDFEALELHSTILIDKRGRVHWARNGGDPFKDFDFLLKEIRRMNEVAEAGRVAKASAAASR